MVLKAWHDLIPICLFRAISYCFPSAFSMPFPTVASLCTLTIPSPLLVFEWVSLVLASSGSLCLDGSSLRSSFDSFCLIFQLRVQMWRL